MNKWAYLGVAATMIFSSTVFAEDRTAENWIVEGNTKIVKTNEKVNINPYNLAKITGVGEGNQFRVLDTYENFDIPLKAPLYSLSEKYCDKILFQDGLWGVQRMVAVKSFDGSEDWALVQSPGYKNNNTTIFTSSNTTPTALWDGISTHFDVFSKEDQKNNRYDGISFGRNTDEFYMRIMNVRKVTTVDALKAYLKAQSDANTPVKFLFTLKEPYFEPFDEDIQNKMNSANLSELGFVDKNLKKVSVQETAKVNAEIFSSTPNENSDMIRFMAAIEDLKIYNSTDDSYYIEGVYPKAEGFLLHMKNGAEESFEGTLLTEKASFTKEKPAEILLKNDGNTSVRILINLSKTEFPKQEMSGFTAADTSVNEACVVKTEMVLPQYVPVVNGLFLPLYLQNALFFAGENENVLQAKDLGEGLELNNNVLTVSGITQKETTSLQLNEEKQTNTTTLLPVSKQAGEGKTQTVLFLGDSIINQDMYTKALSKRFAGDGLKLALIGTRGTEGNRHEGRGGFAAYDYCNLESKFGYENPFLNDGKFDFGNYMRKNKFEKLDSVVINLGINDLNLIGHNSHKEIISYFNQIVKSIHEYDPNIAILLNTPTVLFADEKTNTAKDQRLAFIQTLQKTYADREKEKIFLLPTYLGIDPLMGFKRIEPIIDEFNQNHSLIVTDTTHPNAMGYEALADMTYNYLKYITEFN